MAKAKYLVKSRLDHDNTLYEPGKTVELADDAAAPLLSAGVVEPATAEPGGDRGKGESKAGK